MTSPAFLAVDTDTVGLAGRATAGTAEGWDLWGDRCGAALRNAGADVHSARVVAAIEEYATVVTPAASQVGRQVSSLGVTTASAADVIDNADVESVTLMRQHPSVLARPVNGERAAV